MNRKATESSVVRSILRLEKTPAAGVRQFIPKNDDFGEVASAVMRVSGRFF